MTEYWKSYAKKYCDVCKCWITDNKASVQFHESGKRHKENVAKKINDLVKKATKENKAMKQLDDDMRKMEEAAMKAYMKDVEENPDHSAHLVKENFTNSSEQKESSHGETSSKFTENQSVEDKGGTSEIESKDNASCIDPDRLWYEAKSEDGHTYYWNTQTNESVWEPPDDYVTLEEQNKMVEKQKKTSKQDKKRKHLKETESAKRNKLEVDAALERERMKEKYGKSSQLKENSDSDEGKSENNISTFGPQPKIDPYGGWTSIVSKEEPPVDLQLPPSYQPPSQPVYFTSVEPKVKIKEKTVDTSKIGFDDAPTNFKKRKFSQKGNARQRFDDNDD